MGNPKWGSTSASPFPGKCLTTALTAPRCRPDTKAATWAATADGSEPNDRIPSDGLSGRVTTSATGA